MLSFGKWFCCFGSSISTDEWRHMIYSGLPMSRRQVYEYIASAKKSYNCLFLLQIEVLNPKCRAYTRNSVNSCGASSRFSSATFSERAKFGNKIIQIIRVGQINQHGNQSEPLPGFLVVTSPDSIITQCLQTSLSRDLARGGDSWNSGYCTNWLEKYGIWLRFHHLQQLTVPA